MKTHTTRQAEIATLVLILVLYAITAYAYASRTPDWQIPDEPAHYNYVRQIVDNGELPVIEMGDWDQDYLDLLRDTNFDPAHLGNLDRVQYEDHQPPLYYLLQSTVYWAFDGDLLAMRLFSALLGSGAIVCAWAIIRRIFPGQPWLGLSAAAFIAFLPQRLSIMAGVSNDSLAEWLAGLVLLGVTVYLLPNTSKLPSSSPQTWGEDRVRVQHASSLILEENNTNFEWRLPLALGVLVGLVFLTKSTVYYVAGIAGLAILLRGWREGWTWRFAMQQIASFAIPAVLIGMVWWIHSVDVYGGTDFLGLQRHDEVVVGQPRTDDYIRDVYGGSQRVYWEELTKTTFQSFWGQVGWMALPMKPGIYRVLRLILLLVAIGIIIHMIHQRWFGALSRPQRELLALFMLTIILVFAQFLFYNRTFVQFQGRYLYPALIPMALLIALGLTGWANLGKRWHPLANWLPVSITLTMLLFAWYVLRDVIPVLPSW